MAGGQWLQVCGYGEHGQLLEACVLRTGKEPESRLGEPDACEEPARTQDGRGR